MSQTIFVQYSDSEKTAIIGVFGSPQSTDAFPNQGETNTADPLYGTYYAGLPDNVRIILPAPAKAAG
ncbi:hypothetical protein ACPW65_003326 [Enterobacter roggenkampii]